MKYLCIIFSTILIWPVDCEAQSFVFDDVTITIDEPKLKSGRNTILIFYALPNGNTTAQTYGRMVSNASEWRYGIQHVGAQTEFLRKKLKRKNVVVIYVENKLLSWPAWKSAHDDYKERIILLVDSVRRMKIYKTADIYLNGHSGGGRFIFSFIDAYRKIPSYIKRISFLDSNYGYDSTYLVKMREWLLADRMNRLNIFAYNDSVALFNDKPVVSATGGTWYRSNKMISDLSSDLPLTITRNDSVIIHESKNKQLVFLMKSNPDRKIYHTQQVERNGFIHSILIGTQYESVGYQYYGQPAYRQFVR